MREPRSHSMRATPLGPGCILRVQDRLTTFRKDLQLYPGMWQERDIHVRSSISKRS